MAVHYLVRNIPKYSHLTSKYFYGHPLVRSASVLTSQNFNNGRMEPLVGSCIATTKFPSTMPYKTVDMNQVKAFSITSSKYSAVGHDHTKLWSAERILSAALLGLIPAAFVFPSPPLDTLLAVTFVMHNHWGVEASVIDYVRPSIFGNAIPKIAIGFTYALSIATLVGLFYLIFNGAGLVNTIQLLWRI